MTDDLFDLEELLERVQDDKELLVELLDIFEADFAEKRKLLDQAVANKDIEEVKGIAHSLKGASGNISAKIVRSSFVKLEELAKTGELTGVDDILRNLDEAFVALQGRMSEVRQEFQS